MSNSPAGGSIASTGIVDQATGSGTACMTEALSSQLSALSLATASYRLPTGSFTTGTPRKTIRQKRRDAKTQRRKELLPGATGRPPAPFWGAVSEVGWALAHHRAPSSVGQGPPYGLRETDAKGCCRTYNDTSHESPAAREAWRGRRETGDMSLLMEIVFLPAESGRSPRLPGSTPESSSSDFAPLRLCVSALISSFRCLSRELIAES